MPVGCFSPVWLVASRKRNLLTPESLSGLANQRVISQAASSNRLHVSSQQFGMAELLHIVRKARL